MNRKINALAGMLCLALQHGGMAQGNLQREPQPSLAAATPTLFKPADPSARGISLRTYCEKLAGDRRRIFLLNTGNNRMMLHLNGIYYEAEMIFLKFAIRNRSDADYRIDSLHFVIRESWRETGEESITPLFVYGNTRMIRGQSREIYVFALPRFALPGKRHLDLEIQEKNGGRHLRLRIGRGPFIRARYIRPSSGLP